MPKTILHPYSIPSNFWDYISGLFEAILSTLPETRQEEICSCSTVCCSSCSAVSMPVVPVETPNAAVLRVPRVPVSFHQRDRHFQRRAILKARDSCAGIAFCPSSDAPEIFRVIDIQCMSRQNMAKHIWNMVGIIRNKNEVRQAPPAADITHVSRVVFADHL